MSKDNNNFQLKPIKYVIDIMTSVLTHIYNLSMFTGEFSRQMQIAKIVMLHKGGDINVLAHCRPISLFPIIPKGFKKILHGRLTHFLEKHNIISESQFEFHKKRSTEIALLKQKELIINAFENKLLALGVFIDLTKALDHINHEILLNKLHNYGVRGVALTSGNPTCNTVNSMSHNSATSTTKSINSGMPQGSILGPLLFIVYINDVFKITNEATFIAYADDMSLFFTGTNPDHIVTNANRILLSLKNGNISNSLTINPSKTKAILFKPSTKEINQTQCLFLDGKQITFVKEMRTLGVFFADNFSWNHHIKHAQTKNNQGKWFNE